MRRFEEFDTGPWRWLQTHGGMALGTTTALDNGEAALSWMLGEQRFPSRQTIAPFGLFGDSSVRLRPGEQYRFVLHGAQSSGYTWSIIVDDGTGVVRVTDERLSGPPQQFGLVGGEAYWLFTITALAPGTATVRLALHLPGPPGRLPVREQVIHVAVASNVSSGQSEAEGLGDGSPLVAQALDQCWEQTRTLSRTLSAADNPATASASRIQAETGIGVDRNPYYGATRPKLEAVIRAAFTAFQPPEVILALWAKEGSLQMVTAPRVVPAATTPERARTLFRSAVYYVDLGADYFIVTTRTGTGTDNTWDSRDVAAPAHETHFVARVRELVDSGLLPEDISSAINAELTVSASRPFTVLPSVKFYALSLLLVDALFTRMQRRSFPQVGTMSAALNYLQWNMGTARFQQFLASADTHRREQRFLVNGEPLSLEQWALRTPPRPTEWRQARINAIRFAHYVDSFQPIFVAAMPLIKPGIEELRLPGNVG